MLHRSSGLLVFQAIDKGNLGKIFKICGFRQLQYLIHQSIAHENLPDQAIALTVCDLISEKNCFLRREVNRKAIQIIIVARSYKIPDKKYGFRLYRGLGGIGWGHE